jgi:DNA-binding transcriptional LysR family regulator
MDFEDLALLLAIEKGQSLSAVAKARNVAVSTVARRLDTLEAELKLRLVDRRNNGTRLTPEGSRIAALSGPAIDAGDRIARSAAAMRAGSGRPPLVVSATEPVIAEVLAPALPRLWSRSPGSSITLQSQSRLVSLAARDADLAIRMSRPEGASLMARKLRPLRLGLFASKAYLAGRSPGELNLREERLLVYDDSYGRVPELDWIDTGGFGHAVAMRTGSTRALLTAAIAGAGIAILVEILARRSGLVEVPAPSPLPPRTPWLIVHRDLRRLPEVRAVHGWVTEAFATFNGEAKGVQPRVS